MSRCGRRPWSGPATSPPTRWCPSTRRCTGKSSVRDGLRLVRAGNLFIAAAGACAGGWIALGVLALPKLLVFAALSGVGLGAAGNALNDLADVAADRVNRPGGARPLAAGRLSRHTAEGVVFGGALLGLATAGLVSGTQVLVALGALAV